MAEQGWMTPAEIADAYGEIGATLARQAEAAIRRPKITTTAGVMASLIPPKRDVVRANTPSAEDRAALFGGDAAQMDKPQHMARLLSWALADLMLAPPQRSAERRGGNEGVRTCRSRWGPVH